MADLLDTDVSARLAGASRDVKLGLIGAGPAGRRRVEQIAAETGVRLAMVHDVDPEAAAACADHSGAQIAPDAATVRAACEALVIATPLGARAALAAAALDAGRAVLVEGLPAQNRADVDALYRRAAALDLRLVAARSEPGAMAFAEAVGRERPPPRLVEVSRSAPGAVRRSEVGVCLDLMVDDLEAVCALMGRPPVEVRASVSAGRGERADAMEATVRFRGGGLARLRASRLGAERTHLFKVSGHDGEIACDLVTGDIRGADADAPERFAEALRLGSDARALLGPDPPDRPAIWSAIHLALQLEGVCRAQAI